MSTDFGKRLKAARKSAGLSQVQLSKAVGIGQSTIAELEKEGFGTSHVVKIAAVCGVSAAWLSTGEGEMVPSDLVSTSRVGGGLSVAHTSGAAPNDATLGQTLARLGQELAKAGPQTRAAVADLLSRYAQDPEQGHSLAQAIEMLVRADTSKKASE